MDERLKEYRQWLIQAAEKAQGDFDKTVLSLSGGALGISFAFVKDIVGNRPFVGSTLLLLSWLAWGASATAVLASFYFGVRSFRRTIAQVDDNTVYGAIPGGRYTLLTEILNAVGGLLFLAGLILIVIFVAGNLR